MALIEWFKDLGMNDVERVGGKNASLGEMINHISSLNINVPNGFATTAEAFRDFLEANQLDTRINEKLDSLDVEDVQALARAGQTIRNWVIEGEFSAGFMDEVASAYQQTGF